LFERRQQCQRKINNNANSLISSGYVLFSNNQAFRFGNVPANATNEFEGQLTSFNGWQSEYLNRNYQYDFSPESRYYFNKESAFFAQGALQRTRAIDSLLGKGAAVVCLEYEDAPVPFKIKGRFYAANHIQIVRLVVKPELVRPERIDT